MQRCVSRKRNTSMYHRNSCGDRNRGKKRKNTILRVITRTTRRVASRRVASCCEEADRLWSGDSRPEDALEFVDSLGVSRWSIHAIFLDESWWTVKLFTPDVLTSCKSVFLMLVNIARINWNWKSGSPARYIYLFRFFLLHTLLPPPPSFSSLPFDRRWKLISRFLWVSFFRDEISCNFNLIREKARICSLNLRNSVRARACECARARVCVWGEKRARERERSGL